MAEAVPSNLLAGPQATQLEYNKTTTKKSTFVQNTTTPTTTATATATRSDSDAVA